MADQSMSHMLSGFAGTGDVDTHADNLLAGLKGSAWSPDSSSRLCYEGFSMMMLLYDALSVPYLLCWSVPDIGYWAVGGWFMRVFWTFDLVLSFFTGFWENAVRLEMRLPFTACHYLKTFFILDGCLVLWDWISLFLPHLRFMRVLRLVRFFRQTRRAVMVMHKLKAMVIQKEFHLLLDMSVIMCSIFWLVHLWCCIWYVIGLRVEDSDTGETWLADGDYSVAGS